jgi:hypothetical protein
MKAASAAAAQPDNTSRNASAGRDAQQSRFGTIDEQIMVASNSLPTDRSSVG